MEIKDNLMYTENHEWVLIEGDIAMVGITVPVELWQNIVMLACGAAGVAGFFMSETHHTHGKKK